MFSIIHAYNYSLIINFIFKKVYEKINIILQK